MRKVGATLVAGAIGLIGALALVSPAHATQSTSNKSSCVTETHYNLNGIDIINSEDVEVNLTDEGVEVLTKTFNASGVKWTRDIKPVKLSDVKLFSAWMEKQEHAQVKAAMPALFLNLTLPENKSTKLTFEPYYQAGWDNDAKPNKVFRADNGKWWANNDALVGHTFVNAGSYATNQTLAEIAANNPEAMVVGYGFQQTWAQGLKATVNDVKFASVGKCKLDKWELPREIAAPQEPTFANATCDEVAKVTIPANEKKLAWYTLNGEPVKPGVHELAEPGEYIVEARTFPRFVFPKEALVKWTFAVTEPECATPTTPPATNPPATVPPASGNGGGSGLPVTGPQAALLSIAGVLIVAAGIGFVVLTRKRRVVTELPE